jgi:hypothetical protein
MFGFFKKRKTPPAGPPEPPPPALGWEFIEKAFARLYPGQKPRHWAHKGVLRMHDLKNPPENPLDGVSVYDGGAFWHYVGLGLSDLYVKTSEGDWSGFGYEFTFRLAKAEAEQEPPLWPLNVLISLARAQFAGSDFAPGHTAQTGPIDGRNETRLTALLFVKDPSFELQDTPHGKLGFLLIVGVEAETRERALQVGGWEVIDELRARNPEFITRM